MAAAKIVFSDVLAGIEGPADVIVANPPYLVDDDRRLYRHGGGELGISLAVRIAEESLDRLYPGGRLILYSGTPIIGGADPLFEALQPVLKLNASHCSYGEIDPDVLARNSTGRRTPTPIELPPSASQPPNEDEFSDPP